MANVQLYNARFWRLLIQTKITSGRAIALLGCYGLSKYLRRFFPANSPKKMGVAQKRLMQTNLPVNPLVVMTGHKGMDIVFKRSNTEAIFSWRPFGYPEQISFIKIKQIKTDRIDIMEADSANLELCNYFSYPCNLQDVTLWDGGLCYDRDLICRVADNGELEFGQNTRPLTN